MWALLGRLLSVVAWPAIWFHLKDTKRVRVVIYNKQNPREILLMKDWLSSQAWSMAGGGVKNECTYCAAQREVREELGIDEQDINQFEYLADFVVIKRGIKNRAILIKLGVQKDVKIKHGWPEVLTSGWFSVDELPARRDKIVDLSLDHYLKSLA